jgi:act minimal PKS chain-length factor (CLF/KS beta)
VATALLAMRDSVLPPTVGVAELVPDYEIDLVRDEPRPCEVRAALIIARGYGGFNAALVLRAPDSTDSGTATGGDR